MLNRPETPLEPKLITFDFGDTLVTAEPTYLERMAQAFGELGHPRSLEEVTGAYLWADVHAAEELIPRAPFSPEDFRASFGKALFEGLGLAKEAKEIGPPLMKRLVELRPKRVMMPGALETLQELANRGYALGIISNNDGFTREKCRDTGIEEFFMFILDSTVEGMMKPDPRIFKKALSLAGLHPSQVLHAGDLWGCDVMGPAAVGIRGVWLGNDIIDPAPIPGALKIKRLIELTGIVKN